MMNSWGRGWGRDGYAWVDYDVIRERTRQAAVLDVAPSTRPPPMISSPVLPPSRPPLLSKLAPVGRVRGLVAPDVKGEHIPAIPKIEPDAPVAERGPVSNSPADTPMTRPAEIEDLQGLSCAKIAVQSGGERKSLAGFVASAADLELVKQVAADVPGTLLGEVAVAPWPQCEVLLTLDAQLAGADRPSISIDSPGPLREGDRLRLEVRSPTQTSYIYVVYVQVDGSVVTLGQPAGVAPRPTPPGSTIAFGDGPKGFTIGRPFGREMIIALASRTPLFEQGLLARQTEREFLSTLRRALIYKPSPAMPEPEVAAAVAILETRAR
jgi:Domain of unknown function (DUF4384)